MRRWTSEFLHQLETALTADIRPEVETAMRVAALRERGLAAAEVLEELGIDRGQYKAAVARVNRATAPKRQRQPRRPKF
jgi:hypothetical protein